MTNYNRENLKQLKTMQSKTKAELNALQIDNQAIKKEITIKQNKLNKINEKIKKIESNDSDIIVSEHAIIRYLERVLSMDMELISNTILPAEVKKDATVLGNGIYPVENGKFSIVVRDGVVVTVHSENGNNTQMK